MLDRMLKEDERYVDLTFAVDNAFKRARRLQDRARFMRGGVKYHERQPVGTVVRMDPSRECGCLAADSHKIYFNCNSILDGASNIAPGTRVS